MNKSILTIMLLICVASAAGLEKNTGINITNCWNATITLEQEEGAPTEVGFKGCTKQTDGTYQCNCYNTANDPFWIIIVSDGNIIREAREYEIKVDSHIMQLKERELEFDIKDWGDYIDNATNIKSKLVSNDTKYIEVPVYINKTVEKIVKEYKYINTTEYIKEYYENTTKIEEYRRELNETVNTKDKEIQELKKKYKISLYVGSALIIATLIIIVMQAISYTRAAKKIAEMKK